MDPRVTILADKKSRLITAHLCSMLTYAVTSPFLSIMIRDLGYSQFQVGILFGIFEGAGIIGPPVFGALADRTGNYRLFLVAAFIFPALAAFPLALFVHPLMSALLVGLLAFGLRSTTSLLDAVTTIQIGRTGNYGKFRAWGSVGFVLFVIFLQWTPFLKPSSAGNIAFWIALAAVLSIAPVLLLPRTLPRAAPQDKKKQVDEIITGTQAEYPKISSILPYVVFGFALIITNRFSMAAIHTYFPLYLTEELNWNAIGMMMAIAAGTEIPCIFFSGALIRRWGPLPLLGLAAAGVAVRLAVCALFPYKPLIIAAQLLHSLCYGIFHPAAVSFVTGIFPPERRGLGMSLYMAIGQGFPLFISNMTAGAIAQNSGYRPLFAVYAVIAGAGGVLYLVLRSRIKPFDRPAR